MSRRWRSRCVGAVSAVALATAVERNGLTMAVCEVADADAGGDAFLVIGAVGGEGGERVLDPVEQVPDLQARRPRPAVRSGSWVVSSMVVENRSL